MGWSDVSQQEADLMAKTRLNDAFEKLVSGEKITLVERRVSYNGAEGMPIREEILEEIGDTVITRNIYGAHCLNVQNTLFADIDFDTISRSYMINLTAWAGFLISVITFFITKKIYLALGIFSLFLIIRVILKKRYLNDYKKTLESIEKKSLSNIDSFCKKHPEFKFRVYRTPSGLRLLALNDSYNPKDNSTIEFLKELGSDSNYIQMCVNQNCFRARVSPKPWRINLKDSLPHKKAVWPYSPEILEERRKWIEKYEAKSSDYASCKYIDTIGTGGECSEAVKVQELHDNLCRAFEELPTA